MVESIHDKERLARIEQMVELLQREAATRHVAMTKKRVMAVAALMPSERVGRTVGA